MSINSRISEIEKHFFGDKRGSKKAFCEKLDVKSNTASNWMREGYPVGKDVITKILTCFPDVDASWLIYGKGTIIKDKDSNSVNYMNVPLVNQYAHAGFLSGYGDQEYFDELPTVPFIVNREYKGRYVAFEVKGDSMDDGLKHSIEEGDILLGREVAKDYWKSKLHIKQWDEFIIAHRTDGIIVKQITDHDVEKGLITCHSYNPIYEDRIVDLRDVIGIYNVVKRQRNK